MKNWLQPEAGSPPGTSKPPPQASQGTSKPVYVLFGWLLQSKVISQEALWNGGYAVIGVFF